MTTMMKIQRIAPAGVARPFGDERTVQQAFPAAVNEREADPFLMCDYFDSRERTGPAAHEDDFPVDWHPHRGMDIASYLRSGTGRHADSLGHRGTYETPGMQWMSVGSGVMHTEGGANEKGTRVQGLQIWINVPSQHKMDPPDYGTVTPDKIPLVSVGKKTTARILAGDAFNQTGPFRTKQSVLMIDFQLDGKNAQTSLDIPIDLDTVILYVYEGSLLSVNGDTKAVPPQSVLLLDANETSARGVSLSTNSSAGVILFAGKKLKETIAWHGPIVMNTQEQITETFAELRSGRFPPTRVDWDYRVLATKPKDGEL